MSRRSRDYAAVRSEQMARTLRLLSAKQIGELCGISTAKARQMARRLLGHGTKAAGDKLERWFEDDLVAALKRDIAKRNGTSEDDPTGRPGSAPLTADEAMRQSAAIARAARRPGASDWH